MSDPLRALVAQWRDRARRERLSAGLSVTDSYAEGEYVGADVAYTLCADELDAARAGILAPHPQELKPDDVPGWVQIRAGNELAELVHLVRFAPGQVTAFLHSEHDAQGLLWRWFLKWVVWAAPLAPRPPQRVEKKEK